MLKKVMTYTDFDGVERTESFYFNLTKAELTEMELGTEGGLAEKLQRIVDAKDAPVILRTFKELILKAYGQKSDDGRRFVKNERIRDEFAQTQAYSDLFMELSTNADSAAAFVNGIVPSDLDTPNLMANVPSKN